MLLALVLCGVALLVVPMLALAHLLTQRGLSVRVDVHVPGPEGASPPPSRSRTRTLAAPRAQGIPRNGPPPHADTWDGTTPAPRCGASGDIPP